MTDTPEMVERVALAINQEFKRQWNAAPAPGREFDPESWTATGGVIDLTEIARVASAAMREPTEAMKLAGSLKVHAFKGTGAARQHVTEVWQAMNDAASGDRP